MDYQTLLQKINFYKEKYNVKCLGNTNFNRKIFAVEKVINKSFATAIFVAGVHAREYITTELLCKMLDDNLFSGIREFNISFILMANPDGIELCINGIESAPEEQRCYLVNINHSDNFEMWKANGIGEDINNNFDANFGTNVASLVPCSSGFIGKHAESVLETKILADYTRKMKPFITISYHSKGEEIYYNFFQEDKFLERDKLIAERFEKSTGYTIKNVEMVSSGGYKDWCVQKLKIPALTIEIGSDSLDHPINIKHLNEIYNKHNNVAKDLQFAYNVYRVYEGI